MPSLRGKEKDRRPGDILAEVEALVAEGVLEVTLLGQNVNSYGVEFGDRQAFGKLLRACGEIDGLERVRFTSPHPRDFTDDVIAAMAETPQRHAAAAHAAAVRLGRGAARRCGARTGRSATSASSTGCAPRCPDAAITTDIIVGFPGETEARLRARPSTSCGRRGSPARSPSSTRSGRARPPPTMADQVPADVVQERYERLVALVDEIAWAENRRWSAATVEVLVAEGEGRKDAATHRLSRSGARQPAGALRPRWPRDAAW